MLLLIESCNTDGLALIKALVPVVSNVSSSSKHQLTRIEKRLQQDHPDREHRPLKGARRSQYCLGTAATMSSARLAQLLADVQGWQATSLRLRGSLLVSGTSLIEDTKKESVEGGNNLALAEREEAS